MEQHKRFVIIAPKSMSKSARNLKKELELYITAPIILVSPNSKTYQGRWSDYVVNWGYGKQTDYIHFDAANNYWDISKAVNKLTTFKVLQLKNVKTVDWTEDHLLATKWWKEDGLVIGRTTLTGHGGDGIVVFTDTEPTKGCKLYTRYKKKKNEYRVHVFNKEVIDITQKKKKLGAPELNTKIRNHQNGWVYCRFNIHITPALSDLAVNAVTALELHHGAVDIIWNEKENKYYVLEVNTAPGLVGTTLTKYAQAFSKEFNK